MRIVLIPEPRPTPITSPYCLPFASGSHLRSPKHDRSQLAIRIPSPLDALLNVRYNSGAPEGGQGEVGRSILPVRRYFNPVHRSKGRPHVRDVQHHHPHVCANRICRHRTLRSPHNFSLPLAVSQHTRILRAVPCRLRLSIFYPPKTNPIKPTQNPRHNIETHLFPPARIFFLQNKPILPHTPPATWHFNATVPGKSRLASHAICISIPKLRHAPITSHYCLPFASAATSRSPNAIALLRHRLKERTNSDSSASFLS